MESLQGLINACPLNCVFVRPKKKKYEGYFKVCVAEAGSKQSVHQESILVQWQIDTPLPLFTPGYL